MIREAEVLRPLVEECLDDDPAVRSTIATVCERIHKIKDLAYTKEPPQENLQLIIYAWKLNVQQRDDKYCLVINCNLLCIHHIYVGLAPMLVLTHKQASYI